MLLDGHQSATVSRPTQVSTRSSPPAPSVSQAQLVARARISQVNTPQASTQVSGSASARATSKDKRVSLTMPVQPALSFQASSSTFQAATPLAKAPLGKDGSLDHQQAATSIGISPGLLNCYVAIYRSLGGQMPVQQGAAGFERRFDTELVAGFASVRQQVRQGADIRSAMAALQLRQQDTKPSKTKKRKEKLEHLLALNAHLSQQVSELRSQLSAIKQQTVHAHTDDHTDDHADDYTDDYNGNSPNGDSQDIAA